MRPADKITILFSSLLFLITVFSHDSIHSSGYLMIIYGSIIFFQVILSRMAGINAFLSLTRDIIFPVVGVLMIFDSLGLIVHSINPQDIDYLLIRADYMIFGCYPTVFLEKFIYPPLTDLLQLAYSTYYFLPVALGVVLKMRGRDKDFEKTLFFLLLCFYISYVGYLLFPALGPRYAMEHLQSVEVGGFLVSKPIQQTLNLLEGVKRDAFPSGHTGIALTVLYLSFRYERSVFRALLVPVILLIIATVYCRYHYVVDVMGGVLLFIVTIGVGEVYYKFLGKKSDGCSLQQG